MATRKSSTTTFNAIDDSILGDYAVNNYSERVYSKVYYSIRELCGLVAKRSLKEGFDWNNFKERFTSDFGKVEENRYSLEQLLEYANRKFGKTLEDLIVQNQISWQRRQEYAERSNMNYQSKMIEDSTCY
ncbi:hypothetical protein [Calothrix sp. PCC 6303]|uniref:hypothetical protein n=1 Tax=Calothrix sp. PCC 6303 TaxID=1170562 RepID=UPI0002A02F35|nr:hypothetical protein [Calothrix sp. PCC 6303]AFZ01258.1 hypothetical protein Cal6303_2241 [Calothrix sp. PCC 6303]